MMTSISSEYYQFLLAQGICSSLGAVGLFGTLFTLFRMFLELLLLQRRLVTKCLESGNADSEFYYSPLSSTRLCRRRGLGFIRIALWHLASWLQARPSEV